VAAVTTDPNDSGTTVAPNTENPYSTSRNSRATAFAWKSKIDFEYLQHVQRHCAAPMQKLGYRLIGSRQERDDPDFQILEKTPGDISEFKLESRDEK
jgi:hypothetical protein